MRYSALTLLVPCALVLSACTTPVTPAFKDIGTRSGPCIEGGPDAVAQQFYDYRIQHRGNDLTALRPYLSDNLAKLLTDASRDPQHNALLSSDPFSMDVGRAGGLRKGKKRGIFLCPEFSPPRILHIRRSLPARWLGPVRGKGAGSLRPRSSPSCAWRIRHG